jgi:quercetin dioxygenase-like cupin family protein
MKKDSNVEGGKLPLLRKGDAAHVSLNTNPGTTMNLKISGEETRGNYEIWQVDLDKGALLDLHEHHNRIETFIVLNGKLEMGLKNEQKYVAHGGEMVHLPSFTPHKPTALEPSRILIINSPGDMLGFMEELIKLTPEQRRDKEFMTELTQRYDEYILEYTKEVY